MLRKEALANNLARRFGVRSRILLTNCKTPLPTGIEGVSGGVQIVEFWRTHLSNLLNCVSIGPNSSAHACEYGCDAPFEELVVYIEEVSHAIEKLDLNKACGSDGIYSEHLKYASNVRVPLLAMCFTSFISHGFLTSQCCQ